MCEILFSLIRLISKNSQFFSSEFLLNKNRAFLLKLHFKVIFFLLIFAPLYFLSTQKSHFDDNQGGEGGFFKDDDF